MSTRRAALAVLADQAIVSGSSFVTSVVLVRALGLEGFGAFSLAWLLVVFAVSLQQALVTQPMLTFAPKHPESERAGYLAATLRLQLAFSVLAGLAATGVWAFVLAHWDSALLAGSLVPLVAALLGRQMHAFVRGAAFATGRRGSAFANDCVAYPGQLAALFALAWADRLTLANALWAIAVASWAASLVALAHLPAREPADIRRTARRHWRFARWLAGMALVQWFASNAFLVAAAALLGTAAVGAIKAAQALVGVLHLLFLALENVLPVEAAHTLVERGRPAMLGQLARIGGMGLAATALVSGGLAAFARPLLSLAYGSADTWTVTALRALALLYVFAYLITVLQIAFRTLEATRPVALVYMACTLCAVLCAQPVVAAFGFGGAVYGMATQQGLVACGLWAVLARGEARVVSEAPVRSFRRRAS